jgi:hypothetical protein
MTVKKRSQIALFSISAFLLTTPLLFALPAARQKQKSAATIVAPLLTRTATRHEQIRLGYGGTVTLIGAPKGSITIEGWPRSEVDVTADIQLQAETEADLARLATVNGFALDADLNHVRILSTGTHDKEYMRRVAKNFPKQLLGLPWKIDYRIRVPASTDLEINAGSGAISLKGVEGAIQLSATESEATMTLTGGTVSATLAAGKVNVKIPVRSWRGTGADIRIAAGDLIVELPAGFNGDIDADILRLGKIEDTYETLQSRERPGISERVVKARAGGGGAFFKFTVGDGTIQIRKTVTSNK